MKITDIYFCLESYYCYHYLFTIYIIYIKLLLYFEIYIITTITAITIDTSEEDSEEGTEGLRRSRRATKGRRFAYWKGERPIYEEGTMVGLITAEPTPKKPKRSGKHVGRPKLHKTKDQEDEQDEEIIQSKLPPIVLPKKVKYISREECEELEVWDENTENSTTLRVICPTETLQPPMQLPRTARRPPGRDKLGYAAHSFNVPEVPGKESGWIAGMLLGLWYYYSGIFI